MESSHRRSSPETHGPQGLIVYITTASEEEAHRIGRALVERRLAACVNIVPAIRSLYWWEGAVQDEAEALLLAKTVPEAYEPLAKLVRELHSYSVPAISAVPIRQGNPDYMKWLRQETRLDK